MEITAVNCKGTDLRNINRFYFIPVMSYSRTYRHSNGVYMNQTNINGGNQRGSENGEGSNEEEVNRRHTEISKQGRQVCNRVYYLISWLQSDQHCRSACSQLAGKKFLSLRFFARFPLLERWVCHVQPAELKKTNSVIGRYLMLLIYLYKSSFNEFISVDLSSVHASFSE